jgi:hypothetical protein
MGITITKIFHSNAFENWDFEYTNMYINHLATLNFRAFKPCPKTSFFEELFLKVNHALPKLANWLRHFG